MRAVRAAGSVPAIAVAEPREAVELDSPDPSVSVSAAVAVTEAARMPPPITPARPTPAVARTLRLRALGREIFLMVCCSFCSIGPFPISVRKESEPHL